MFGKVVTMASAAGQIVVRHHSERLRKQRSLGSTRGNQGPGHRFELFDKRGLRRHIPRRPRRNAMAQFLAAIQYVLLNEGGFSDDPNDPGGATNFGILQRELPGVDIRTITREQAISFYLPNYWNKALYANIASQQVATKLFDMHVNLGLVPAVRIAQHALGFQDANVDGDMAV